MSTFKSWSAAGLLLAALATLPIQANQTGEIPRWYKPFHVEYGKQVYAQHCASCHGADAEGAANWTKRDETGRFPPPPLNGTAHAWHHPMGQLIHVIRFSRPNSAMPAWDETLSPGDIYSVIAWFQSLWPEEVYATWHGINEQAKANQ